ncbi:MAG: hypothetical protein M1409_00450 [Actinobacteria bacterium]|nr:hypothetical protein [Actinomycetota bacterium]
MLKIKEDKIEIKEPLGIYHEPQIVEINLSDTNKNIHSLMDIRSGKKFPVQRACESAQKYFVFLEIHPFAHFTLVPSEEKLNIQGIDIEKSQNTAIISNEKFSIEVPYGEERFERPYNSDEISGPIKRIKTSKTWRGKTYFDTKDFILSWHGYFIEEGPLRVIYLYEVKFTKGFYAVWITVDMGKEFVKIEERFETEPTGQIIWDFSDKDLPEIDEPNLDKGAGKYHSLWQPDGYNVAHYLWRFNRGWIEKYDINTRFPYAVAYNPAFMYIPNRKQIIPFYFWIKHYRKVIQITPDMYILIDSSNSLLQQSILFHIPKTDIVCDENKIKADYKDCVLEIIQLLPEKTNLITSVIKAEKERKEPIIDTISLKFNIELANKSVYIISANKTGGCLKTEKREQEIFIEKNGVKYSIPLSIITGEK